MIITKEGSLASFYTVNKAPIKHLRVYFSPKQDGSGNPSPENVREIEGWNGINIRQINANLFNPQELIVKEGYYLNDNGIETVSSNGASGYVCNLTPVIPNSWYHFCVESSEKNGIRFYHYSKNKEFISRSIQWSLINNVYFKVPENCYYISFQYQVNIVDPRTFCLISDGKSFLYKNLYINIPHKSQTYSLAWSNDIGTIYGGYVDLITGQLQNEYYSLELTNDYNDYITRVTKFSDYDIYYFQMNAIDVVPELDTDIPHILCDAYKVVSWQERLDNPRANILSALIVGGGYTRIFFFTEKNKYNSVEDFIASCANRTILFKRETVDISNITSQQLQTFIGQNNIWSNADRVEVEYDLAESNDELYRRRNIILQSAPHLENVSGNLAHFNTDLIAPIKEAKIYFNPIQEGSGDPSPENIREIGEWNGINLYHTGKNVLNCPGTATITINIDITSRVTLPPGTYTFSMDIINNSDIKGMVAVRLNTSYSNYILQRFDGNFQGKFSMNFTLTETSDVRINLGGEKTGYSYVISNRMISQETNTNFNTYQGTSTPIDWSNDIGTIYGGYVDLINGKLVQTYKKINLKDCNWGRYTANQFYITNVSDKNKLSKNVICNMFPISSTINSYPQVDKTIGFWANGANYANLFFIKYEASNNLEDFKTWIQELEGEPHIVYELETPIEYPLTSQQLKTLKGVNNIWSDANGPIEVQYWTH